MIKCLTEEGVNRGCLIFFISIVAENIFICVFIAVKINKVRTEYILFKSLEEKRQGKNSTGKNIQLLIKINCLSMVYSGRTQLVGERAFYGLPYTSSK